MKKTLILAAAAAMFAVSAFSSDSLAGTGCLAGGASCFTTTTVQVDILPGDMCIGSTGAFDFGDFTVSSSAQTVSGAFVGADGYFYVDDLNGADAGYYTTVQLDADMDGPGTATLPRANVFMKTAAVGSAGVTLMTGGANTRVEIDAAMASFLSLDTPRQLIERNNATNDGIIGKYGVLPELQLIIPAYQAVGNYTATLTYTLYDN